MREKHRQMIAHRQRLRRGVLLVAVGFAAAARGQTNPPVTEAPALNAGTYQRLVDENLTLRREQTRLIRDANDLRRRNASLVLQAQELERKQEALSAALADLKSPDELKAELERVRREHERVRQERDTLSRDVERIRAEAQSAAGGAGGQATPSPGAGSDLYRKLERDNAELRAQLAAALSSSQSESKAHLAAGRRETQLTAQVEEMSRQTALQRRELEQGAAREKLLRSALVKVAGKAHTYETALRQAESLRSAQAAATNVVRIGSDPRQSSPALLDAARQCVAAGRYREAERCYRVGLERDPSNAQLHYSLGVLYDDYLQDPRAAALHYRRYLALNPAAADAGIVRSWLLELDMQSR